MVKNIGKTYLGFDLGASSGRAVLGVIDHKMLKMEELCRFPNEPYELDGTLYWDFLALWNQVVESLRKCSQQGFKKLAGIGIDTWGVDFGILGKDDKFIREPLCYRDACTEGMDKIIQARISSREMYTLTGLPIVRVSSLPQLVAVQQSAGADRFKIARTFLMMPDLFRYFLGGRVCSERTIAGSSLLYDINQENWSSKIIKKFGLPARLFPEIVDPGTITGKLKPDLAAKYHLNRAPLIAVAGHDTPSAFAAAPYSDEETVLISCGTWSVVGQHFSRPILTKIASQSGFINEPGFQSIIFVQNLPGLYLFENLKRELEFNRKKISYSQMVNWARKAKPFQNLIYMNAPMLFVSKEPLESVKEYLRKTNQKAAAIGGIIRLLLEGLAFSYKSSIDNLRKITGRTYKRVCLVGGGSRNSLLCQMTADATGLPVIAGPPEATITGNFAIQAFGVGQLRNSEQIRDMVKASFNLRTYKPRETVLWDKHYLHYRHLEQKSIKLQ